MAFFRIRYFIPFLLCVLLVTVVTCKKDDDSSGDVAIGNCDGLVTDTAGTNEQAYVVMANAFTPNGDGTNDGYSPICNNIASYDFKIYDAGNQVVFATTTFGQAWAPAAQYTANQTFYYRVQAVTKENHRIGVCGDVRLLTCLPPDSLAYIYFADQCAPDGHFSLPTADRLSACP